MGCSFSSPYDEAPMQNLPQLKPKPSEDTKAGRGWTWDSSASAPNQGSNYVTSKNKAFPQINGRLIKEVIPERQRSSQASFYRNQEPTAARAKLHSGGYSNGRDTPVERRGSRRHSAAGQDAYPGRGLNHQGSGSSSFGSSARIEQEAAGAPRHSKTHSHHYDDGSEEDEDDDWDRFSVGEDERYSSGGGTSSGGRPLDTNSRRVSETSIFGLTDKRNPMPLRETKSLKLAKLRGCTFVNQYVVIKYLGRGACGRVFLCMDMNDNRLYAVKIVKKVDLEAQRGPRQNQRRKRNPIEDLRREVSIMRTLRHKNIVSLQEVVDDPSGNKMLLVMDYMEGGPVMTREALERGRCIPESLAMQYFRDMCKALDYLHYNKVVHGDLKPENVLMSARGAVTLSDFGCSKVIISGNEYLERCNGTPAFLAPEMMRPHSRYRGRPTDVYALGACLYTFVFGRIPFNAPNVFKLFQVVQNEPLRFPDRPQVTPALQDLLLRMLHKDPKQRITMAKVMKHSWVTKRGAWPLKSVREMLREGVSLDESEAELPDLMATFNVLDVPRQDHLLEVLKPGLPERTFRDGEVLLRQGEQGTHLMYILQGQVEVLVKLPPIRESSRNRSGNGGRAPKSGGSNDADTSRADIRTGSMDPLRSRATELKTSSVPEVIGDDLPPALLEGASKAREFTSTLARGQREFLVAVRSEGQFVGEMASFTTAAVRCATVRAKGTVRVRLIPGELLHDCVERIPEARQQAKEMLWMRQSENMVLEAMTRLSAVHDALEEMLSSGRNSVSGVQSRSNSITSTSSFTHAHHRSSRR